MNSAADSLPTRIVNDVLHQLVRTGLLIEIRNPDDDREVAFAPDGTSTK